MWPIGPIIAVAVVGAVVLMTIGILLAITLERRRHSKILLSHGLTRGLSRYHRPRLSANELNYTHIMPPTTNLRRSIQMPYGIVSFGRDGNSGDDEEKQMSAANGGRVDDYSEVLRPKHHGAIRRGFSGRPLHVQKTRRPGKVRKPVPLELIPKSPLSAITEFSDPPASAPPEATEFSSQSETMLLPAGAVVWPSKHVSTQWPLAGKNATYSTATPTEIMEVMARESVLMRRGGGMLQAAPDSVSAVNTASGAPDEPLPPLPTTGGHAHSKSHDLRMRTSNASLETIGSSVLGTFMNSPANDTLDFGASQGTLDCKSPTYDRKFKRGSATVELQAPPAKKTSHGLVSGKSIRSLHPSVDVAEPSPFRWRQSPPKFPNMTVSKDSFEIVDASTWVLPPLKVNKQRGQNGHPFRRSMIEPSKLAQWRSVSDCTTSLTANDDIDDVFSTGEAIKRPNSVATGNPLEWDSRASILTKRHSLTSLTSLEGPKRGHRRQNCMRITNLPILDVKSSLQRLPQLREEHPSTPVTAPDCQSNYSEIKQPQPMFRPRPPVMDFRSSPAPSPFRNAPILTPTPRPVRKQYIQHPTNTNSKLQRPSGTARLDPDVFSCEHNDLSRSEHRQPSPHQRPHSPNTSIALRTNDTPPSTRPSERPSFESPILPSPALKSSSLYTRKSLVRGPRSPRNTDIRSGVTGTSPLQNKPGLGARATKERAPSGQDGLALNKSVLMLGSMNSDATLLDQPSSQSYGTTSEDKSPATSAMPSPPLNKRILGLRTSSCAPSITSATPSPTLEKPISRGPSPLANTSNSNLNKLNRPDTTRGINPSPIPTLSLPALHLSASPSVRIPSMMSTSGGSIWEDASVRAESPEPEDLKTEHISTPALLNPGKTDQNDRYLYPLRSTLHTRQRSQQCNLVIVTRDFGATQDTEDDRENTNVNAQASHVVQQLERVASSGAWDGKTHHRTVTIDATSKNNYESRQGLENNLITPRTRRDMDVFGGSRKESGVGLGLGLGLKLDNLIVGSSSLHR